MIKQAIFQTEPNKKQASRGGRRAVLFVYGETSSTDYYLLGSIILVMICESVRYWCPAATEGLENMAFIANALSLVTYFYGYMNLSMTKSATTLTNFMGTAFLLTLVGGYISDTYWSRFKTCLIFILIELMVRLWFCSHDHDHSWENIMYAFVICSNS